MISDDEDFECAVNRNERSSTETYTAFVTKKRELFQRYENAPSGDCLPNPLKAEVMLGHSSLTEEAAQKIKNWVAGARDLTSEVQVLCRPDTDVDETSAFRQLTKSSKTFFEHGDLDQNHGMLSGLAKIWMEKRGRTLMSSTTSIFTNTMMSGMAAQKKNTFGSGPVVWHSRLTKKR